LVGKCIDGSQIKEFSICVLAHFIDLKVVALKNTFSLELTIEKCYVSIGYLHQVCAQLQKLVTKLFIAH